MSAADQQKHLSAAMAAAAAAAAAAGLGASAEQKRKQLWSRKAAEADNGRGNEYDGDAVMGVGGANHWERAAEALPPGADRRKFSKLLVRSCHVMC